MAGDRQHCAKPDFPVGRPVTPSRVSRQPPAPSSAGSAGVPPAAEVLRTSGLPPHPRTPPQQLQKKTTIPHLNRPYPRAFPVYTANCDFFRFFHNFSCCARPFVL